MWERHVPFNPLFTYTYVRSLTLWAAILHGASIADGVKSAPFFAVLWGGAALGVGGVVRFKYACLLLCMECFVEPHFVALLPEFVYVGGGNLVEHDYLVYSPEPAAVEEASRGHEAVEKSLRYSLLWRRRAAIRFYRGKAAPEAGGVATAFHREAPPVKVDEEYKAAVRRLYTEFPDLAHLNYFFMWASPEYLKELWEDVEEAGRALAEAEEWRFLGMYLVAKAAASRGECPSQIYGWLLKNAGRARCRVREVRICGDVVYALYPMARREPTCAHRVFHWWVKHLASGKRAYLVDAPQSLGCLEEVGTVLTKEKLKCRLPPPDAIIVRDYDKEAVDDLIERALRERGRVTVVLVPHYAVYDVGERAQLVIYLVPPREEELGEWWNVCIGGKVSKETMLALAHDVSPFAVELP